MSTPISSMMHRGVSCVGLDDTVQAVEVRMAAERLNWVPVVEGRGTVLGVISASDLLRFHADRRDASTVRAWQLCSYRPIAVPPETPVGEVARQMVDKHIHHVVVSDQGTIVGVVSSLDFVRQCVSTA